MRNTQGFTLVEMLVAALIIMIGVTGYVALQSEYVKSDAELNLRAIGLKLAQEKLDDLRQFSELDTNPGVFDFNDIDDNQGGTLAPGAVVVPVNDDATMDRQFVRSWQVVDQYFVDSDADGVEDVWLREGAPGLPANLPRWPSKKQVTVQISWQNYQGENKQVTLNGIVAPVMLGSSLQAIEESLNAKQSPSVDYRPGLAPDVIAYDLGDSKKVETSKPVPEVNRSGDNVQVEFETVKYLELPDDLTKLEQEEFVTVNCQCKLAGEGAAKTPSMTVLVDDVLQVQRGHSITKMTGIPDGSGQPELCNTCCRDHHDTSEMLTSEQFYRQELGSAHRHYNYDSGAYVLASSVGDSYLEACRFKRVDGLFELYPDWQLAQIIEFKQDYLYLDGTLENYTSYIESVIEAKLQGSVLPIPPNDRHFTVAPGGYQMIARGVYLDRMTSSHRSAVLEKIADGDASWKAITPFYDVNLTLLASWNTTHPSIATISQEPIETIIDPENDLYGTYSRGRLEALTNGTTHVVAEAFPFNAGVSGTQPITPFEYALKKVDGTVQVTVDGLAAVEQYYAIVAEINCSIEVASVVDACETNNPRRRDYIDLSALEISASPAHFDCTLTVPNGNATPFYSCDAVSENWTGEVHFAFSAPGYSVVLKVQQEDGSIIETDHFSLSTGLSETSVNQFNLIIELYR